MINEIEKDSSDNLNSLIYSIRINAEFYGYSNLMEMLKAYTQSNNKETYLSAINLNVNPELEKSLCFGPSLEVLEMIFNALSVLDVDFLLGVANLVSNEERATLFEGMIYTGLSKGDS